MVTRLSLFSMEAGSRPGLSGAPGGWAIRLQWATVLWGFLAKVMTLGKQGPYVLLSLVRVFDFYVRWQRRSFLWIMVGKEIRAFPVVLKLCHTTKIPK